MPAVFLGVLLEIDVLRSYCYTNMYIYIIYICILYIIYIYIIIYIRSCYMHCYLHIQPHLALILLIFLVYFPISSWLALRSVTQGAGSSRVPWCEKWGMEPTNQISN